MIFSSGDETSVAADCSFKVNPLYSLDQVLATGVSRLLQVSLQPWPQQDVPEVVPLDHRHGSMDAVIDRIVEVPGVDGTDSKVARWIE